MGINSTKHFEGNMDSNMIVADSCTTLKTNEETVRKEVAKKPKTMEQQQKKLKKYLRKFVEKNAKFSEALLKEVQAIQDKHFWHVYASKDCNHCYGRGMNEISHSNQVRIVPCDCAIKARSKDLDVPESKPLYCVTNKNGSFVYYQKGKSDQRFFVPEGWEKAERVLVG